LAAKSEDVSPGPVFSVHKPNREGGGKVLAMGRVLNKMYGKACESINKLKQRGSVLLLFLFMGKRQFCTIREYIYLVLEPTFFQLKPKDRDRGQAYKELFITYALTTRLGQLVGNLSLN